MDNIDNHFNVTFYYLSNETNLRFLAITVLELWAKKSLETEKNWKNIASLYVCSQF